MNQPRFAALYNVYHDERWLLASYLSVYDCVERVYFFVNDHSWSGTTLDNSTTIDLLHGLPDPDKKLSVVRGSWADEIAQRNFSIATAIVDKLDYGFIVDADEIYEPETLRAMMRHAAAQPEVDVWHMIWFTYWKSEKYRIDPPESYQPPVFTRLGKAGFVETRNLLGNAHALIPPQVGMCHHMSYARSDELIHRKLALFSHSHQIIPGWFENVWKRWDTDHSLENLHPVLPAQYKRAVEQPFEALPSVLREFLKKNP